MTNSSNKPSHLKALLRKNWISWKRSRCISICEILVPFLFALFILLFRVIDKTEDVGYTTFYNNPAETITLDGDLTPFALSNYMKDCTADENGGKVALAPLGDPLVTILNNNFLAAGFQTMVFDKDEDINVYTSQLEYSKTADFRLCFGVYVAKNNENNQIYEYHLRFNTSSFDENDIPETDKERINKMSWQNLESFEQYRQHGFLLIQNYIDNIILQQEMDSAFRIKAAVTSRSLEPYTEDTLAENTQGQMRMFLDLPLLLPFLRFMNGILREKEKKIREGMKMMGLKNSAFYLSWFITYFLIFTVISLLISILLTLTVFTNSNFFLIFIWHWEFSLCLMALGFLITVFFNKAKVGNVAGFVIALLFGFFQSTVNSDSSAGQYLGVSFFPQTSIGLSADHILKLEAVQLGVSGSSIGFEVEGYKLSFHYIAMLIDIIIFLLVGSYLDQVLPQEFGIKKHPLFCLMRKKNQVRREVKDEKEEYLEKNAKDFEQIDPAFKLQDQKSESIQVKNLKKIYANNKVAVNGVSFNMYQSQIFALLGHNGAGKTTTISMITGLFGATQGSTKIFGLDVEHDLDEVRKNMGVCPQHDILFDNLTVKEHFELYAVFKGLDAKDIPAEVEKMIEDTGLAEKRDYLSKNLSGGQRRKLSIGIAFIGGSKFIVLDEPSSGMDTSARRKLWDMLKNYKHNRIVLLTTHFMDEADYLGDRIGIMAEGELKCLGSSLFLKSRFGLGYNLTLVKKDINDPSQPIKEIIQKHVPDCKVLSDVSAEIAYQLPLDAAPKFKALFDDLDINLEKLKVSAYGISVTTLEEVFLNVAKINAPEKHFEKKISPKVAPEEDFDDYDIKDHKIEGAWATFATHFSALVRKRVQYFKRDKRGLVCEIIMPILIIVAGVLMSKSAFSSDMEIVNLAGNVYEGNHFKMTYNTIVPSNGLALDSVFLTHLNSDYYSLNPTTATDLVQFDLDVLNAQGKDVVDDPVNIFSVFVNTFDTANKVYDYFAFIDTRAQEGSAYAMNKVNNAILKTATNNADKTINLVISPFHKTQGTEAIMTAIRGILYAFVFATGMSFIPASLITFIVKEREVNAKHQQLVSGVSITAYWFSNFFVDYVKYLFPAVINALLAMAMDASAIVEGDKLGACWAIFLLYGVGIIPFVYLMGFLFKDYGTAQIASFFFNFGTGFIGGVAMSFLRLFESTQAAAKGLHWILRILPTFSMTYGFINLANRDAYTLVEDRTTRMDVFDMNLAGGDVLYLALFGVIFFALIFLIEYLRTKQSISSMLTNENSVPYVPQKLDSDVEQEMKEIEHSDNNTYTIKVDKLRKVYNLGGGKHKVAVDRLSFGVKNGDCFALLGVNGAGKTTTFKILSGDYVQTSGKAYINGFEIPSEIAQARKNIGYCPQYDSILELLTAKEHLYMYSAIKGIPSSMRARIVEKHLREMNLKQYENIPAGTYSGGNKRKLCVAIAMIGNPAVVFLDEPSTGMDPEARRFMWNVISRISRERKQSSIILTTHSMEEAEALATKMGIMVNGNLKCLGTSQHIKSKYGGGYEIEVKLELPTKDQVSQTLKSAKLETNSQVDQKGVENLLEKFQTKHLLKELNDDGAGSAIYSELKRGSVSAHVLVEWILIENMGENLKEFLKSKFGEMSVVEHFQTFYRFKTPGNVSVGNFFGSLEENKTKLSIQQYSIKQCTIEQIFNNFAVEDVCNYKEGEVAINVGVAPK